VDPDDPWNARPVPAAACAACGFTQRALHRWVDGAWRAGTMLPLTYKERAWAAVNEVKETFDWQKMYSLINRQIGRIEGARTQRAVLRFLAPAARVFQHVACVCGGAGSELCANESTAALAALREGVEVASCTMDGGYAGVCESVRVDADSFEAGTRPTISEYRVPPLVRGAAEVEVEMAGFEDGPDAEVTLGAIPSTVTPYEIVYDTNGTLIGQVAGAGVRITVSEEFTGTVRVCPVISAAIPTALWDYGTPAVALGNDTRAVVLGAAANVTREGLLICATVNETGTYFPAFVAPGDGSTEPSATSDSSGDDDGLPTWLIITTCCGAGVILIAAVISIVTLRRRQINEAYQRLRQGVSSAIA
jgi:hypothetical protein